MKVSSMPKLWEALSLGLATMQRGATPGGKRKIRYAESVASNVVRHWLKSMIRDLMQPLRGREFFWRTWGSRSLSRVNPRLNDFTPLG